MSHNEIPHSLIKSSFFFLWTKQAKRVRMQVGMRPRDAAGDALTRYKKMRATLKRHLRDNNKAIWGALDLPAPDAVICQQTSNHSVRLKMSAIITAKNKMDIRMSMTQVQSDSVCCRRFLSAPLFSW